MSLQASTFLRWLPTGSERAVGAPRDAWSETRSATARTHDTLLDAVERLYNVSERNTVREFLAQRPFLIPLLLEAPAEIRSFFANAPLQLMHVVDPEDGADQQLAVYVVTAIAPLDAVQRLHELDQAWWLDALPRAQGDLFISITPNEL